MAPKQSMITTQRTSKTLKVQLFLSLFLILFGCFSWFLPFDGGVNDTEGLSWSATMVIVGGIWYVGTRVMIWWQHG